ncbi:uncharacterized protein LOC108674954 [Hyalella azteca]|uniref:Uncharacterized protein LOC108674954 n=1 Tax=Hyalella azteca TaxID=294128 RepID=A0A8B7NXA3_HYAAZ|nr:uncharacterized protein LOC108674954 [Hyalella azteca]
MSCPPDAPRDHALLKRLQGDESGKAGPTIKSKPFFGTQASCSPCSSNPASPTREDAQSGVLQSRRALRNEDSSYDSDFESSEVLGPASTASGPDEAPLGEEQHEDVSRTVSDTLAAEFAEYVTMQPNTSTTPVLPTATSKTIVTSDEVTSTTSCSSPVFVASSFSVPTGGSSAAMDLFSCSESTAKDVPVITTVGASNALVCVDKSESVARTQPSESKPETTTAKSLLTSTSSLPSHSVLSSKGGINTGSSSVTIRPHTSVVSSLSSRPSSAPATQSLARSASTAVTSQAGSAPTSTSISTSIGKTWSGSESSIYGQQVEFGIKLGYSESLVQLALKKLGGKPAKNELLDELIRLGAVMPKSESELEGPLATPAEGDDAKETDPSLALRPIIIDGSNVAMSHGNKNVFSCRGLSVCVEWFRERGHKEILVFVPAWRKEFSRWDAKITDQQVLEELEQQKVLVFTPSRTGHTSGRRIIPYDDRYILNEAVLSGGVVVSNDNFRDLAAESSTFRRVVEEALLMYSWVNGRFVPPDDPLGRNGPTLDAFLRRPVSTHSNPQARDLGLCPYGKKCTYGNKCKYQHPERGTQPIKSVTERLQEQREKHYLDKATKSRDSSPGESSRANNSQAAERGPPGSGKKPLSRTPSSHGGSSLSSTTACLPTPPVPHDAPGHDSRFSDASTPTTTSAAPATAHQGVPSSPAPATTAAPLLMQQQHPMLSAQPSYDQSSLQQSLPHDVFKNQMFSSDSCLHPSFASQAHTVQHQHLHHQPSGPHQQSSSHTAVQRMQSYQQVAAAGGWGYQPPRPQDACETSHFSELAMAERQPSDTDSASSCDNTHQKLRRQLTLNPSNDHRLAKINKEASQQKSVPMAGHFGGLQSMPPQYQQQLQTMNMASNQHLISQHQYQNPLQSFSPFIPEQNLLQQTPQSQMGPVFSVNQSPLPSHLYRHHQQQQQQGAHPHVARFSSAPDPIVGSTSTCSNAQLDI